MTLVILLARVALAAVFVVSAISKLRDRDGSRSAVEAFGVPTPIVPAVTLLLPVAELVCAALLLVADPGATLGAAASLLLLLAFTGAVLWNLARGRQPECHCFGELSGSGGIGPVTVARNAVLIVLAALPLLDAGELPGVTSSVAAYSEEQVALGAVLLLLLGGLVALALVHRALVARYGALLLRMDEVEERLPPPPFRPTPVAGFTLADLDGETVSLAEVLDGGSPALVVFISPSCTLCQELVPDLVAWQAAEIPLRVLVVSSGSVDANRRKIGAGSRLEVLLQDDQEVAADYGMQGTPAAFLAGVDGLLASPPAYGVEPIRRLYASVSGAMSKADGSHPHPLQIGRRPVAVGDPLPDMTVVDETGAEVPLLPLVELETLLLFWRTDCGYCASITDQVTDAEEHARVLIVSGSGVEAVRGSGLSSPVVRDPGDQLGTALQVPGTPTAVLVREGRVVEGPAAGGPGVLGLLLAADSAKALHAP